MAALTSAWRAEDYAPISREAGRELSGAGAEIFGNEVKDLCAVMGGGAAPGCRLHRSFNGIANVLAVAKSRLAYALPLGFITE